jgi:hypothetical protein
VADKRNGLCSSNDNQSHGGEFMDGGHEHARDCESAIGRHKSDFWRGQVLSVEAAMTAQFIDPAATNYSRRFYRVVSP